MDKIEFVFDLESVSDLIETNPAEAVRTLIRQGAIWSSAVKAVAVVRNEWENDEYEKWADAIEEPQPVATD
jgi:ribosomal protein L19E